MKISVICATLGPLSDVESLLTSIETSVQRTQASLGVEFILVDQSIGSHNYNFPKFDRVKLTHIRNEIRGLSLNRNIGLERATGEWLLLIDSDCIVSEDYFENFLRLCSAYPMTGHFIGRISDLKLSKPLFRSWPKTECRLSTVGVWYYCTSINSIFKNVADNPFFDERFGLGAKFGSCEDIDFFLRLNRRRMYAPDLLVCHPDIFSVGVPSDKLNSYSYGFGALCAKHCFPVGLLMLLASFLKKFFDLLRGRVAGSEFVLALGSRTRGFFDYLSDRIRRRYG